MYIYILSLYIYYTSIYKIKKNIKSHTVTSHPDPTPNKTRSRIKYKILQYCVPSHLYPYGPGIDSHGRREYEGKDGSKVQRVYAQYNVSSILSII